MASDSTAPSRSDLHQAALNYIARYASSVAGLRQVLQRRIQRWSRAQIEPDPEVIAAAKADVEAVISALVQGGLVNDQEFAKMRAKSLARAGQSARAVRARLAAKGISTDIAQAAIEADPDDELAAALITARRRRIGPYRSTPASAEGLRDKEFARLARAGFSHEVAQRALEMTAEEAERRIHDFRR